MLKKSLSLIAVTGVCLTLISEFFSHPLINIFVGYDADLFAMTLHGFRLYAFVFLINGFNIWASSFFTALNNGVVSGMIAFLRTLLFQIGCIMLLPILLGLNGIWMGVVVAPLPGMREMFISWMPVNLSLRKKRHRSVCSRECSRSDSTELPGLWTSCVMLGL